MTADEMFKKLGFEKVEDKELEIVKYIKDSEKIVITFYEGLKEYEVTMDLNEAIQTKLKELGWIE